jgi:hypothetical protein
VAVTGNRFAEQMNGWLWPAVSFVDFRRGSRGVGALSVG